MEATTPGSSWHPFALTRCPCFGRNALSSSHCIDIGLQGGLVSGDLMGGFWESGNCSQKNDEGYVREGELNTSNKLPKNTFAAAGGRFNAKSEPNDSDMYLGDVGGLGLSWLGQRWADRPIKDQRDARCQLSGLPRGQQTDGNGNEPAESSF